MIVVFTDNTECTWYLL